MPLDWQKTAEVGGRITEAETGVLAGGKVRGDLPYGSGYTRGRPSRR